MGTPIDMSQAGWITVHFTEEEQQQIIQVGSSRRGAKEASGMSGEKLEAEYQEGYGGFALAFAAEYALAKLLGVEPDTKISRTGNGGQHATLEVDGTEYTFNAAYVSDPTYDLKFTPSRVPDADVFMLVSGDVETMRIMGGVSAEVFQQKSREVDYGYGLRLMMEQADLTPARTIAGHMGLDDRLSELDEAHREKRLQRQAQFGSLFGPRHQDPA